MSTATVRPEVVEAIDEIRFATHYPLQLEVVTSSGRTEIVPLGTGYGISVSDDATEEDIYDLEPTLERIADTIETVWAL